MNIDQRPQPEFPCLQSTDKPVLLTASSVQEGIKVKECIYIQIFGVEFKEGLQNGIFLGKQSYHQLTEQETADVQHWISDIDLGKISPLCLTFTRVLKVNDFDLGVVYRVNEHVIVRDAEDDSKEWVTKITAFYVCGPVNGSYHLFFKGKFYAAKSVRGRIVTDSWTGQPLLIQKDYHRLCVYSLRLIDRKVILYPDNVLASSFLVIDPDHPVSVKDITIPYYPSINDVVRMKAAARLVLVKEIDDTESIFRGHELQQIRGCADRFSITIKIIRANCSSVECQIPHRIIGDCIYID